MKQAEESFDEATGRMIKVATIAGREFFRRPTLRESSRADLLVERDEMANEIARSSACLATGDDRDGTAAQLRGSIALYLHWIEEIDDELACRDRARAYGYRELGGPAEDDLRERFVAARMIDCGEIMRALTWESGKRTGDRMMFPCPFRDDTQPSLVTYPPGRGWHCFPCGEGGDAVALVAKYHGLSMVAALRLIESGELGTRLVG
ncbi:MAG: CHC2 zinc finger domain-containing protein [Thermomicrobiales bacterium]